MASISLKNVLTGAQDPGLLLRRAASLVHSHAVPNFLDAIAAGANGLKT
jgi:hypothetical protein